MVKPPIINAVKDAIVSVCPEWLREPILRRRARKYWGAQQHKGAEGVFSDIHRNNLWACDESISGVGSTMAATEVIRGLLPRLVSELKLTSILDAPCGDMNWMRSVQLGDCRYIGADIVKELVDENQQKFGDEKHAFQHLNVIDSDLPRVDLILCRDCFIHLSIKQIQGAIRNFKRSGSKYLLTTTFPRITRNHDIPTGAYRRLNLQISPFDFPAPMGIYAEYPRLSGSSLYTDDDKSLALWSLDSIPA